MQVLLDIPHHPRKHKKRKTKKSKKTAEKGGAEFGSDADDSAGVDRDGDVTDDAVVGDGGGLLQKNAKNFLKRMAKAFAGGGGKGGGAKSDDGGDDTWDAAQTVIWFSFPEYAFLGKSNALNPECFPPAVASNSGACHGGACRSPSQNPRAAASVRYPLHYNRISLVLHDIICLKVQGSAHRRSCASTRVRCDLAPEARHPPLCLRSCLLACVNVNPFLCILRRKLLRAQAKMLIAFPGSAA